MSGEELPADVQDQIRAIVREEVDHRDTVVSDQISGLESSVSRWIEKVEAWMDESREDRAQLRALLEQNTTTQQTLVDFLYGEPEADIDGQVVRYGGLKRMVEDVIAQVNANGGWKINVPWKKVAGILTLVGGLVAGIVQIIEVIAH